MYVSLSVGQNATTVLWKLLSHASRFSESVMIEFAPDALVLRFTAPNRTTHMCVKFPVLSENVFTSTYKIEVEPSQNDEWIPASDSSNSNVAHIMCRPLILALKPSPALTLMKCTIEFRSHDCHLRVTNQYAKGFTKRFDLSLSETLLEKPVDVHNADFRLKCNPFQLNKIFEVFPPTVARLTMKPELDKVCFTAESNASNDTPSMDSSIGVASETFSVYRISPNTLKFSKTFDPKGFRAFLELASFFRQPIRIEAGPGTNPVSLELQCSDSGIFTMSMLIASYDEMEMRGETESFAPNSHLNVPTQEETSNILSMRNVNRPASQGFTEKRMTRNEPLSMNLGGNSDASPIVPSQTRLQCTPAPVLSLNTVPLSAREPSAQLTSQPTTALRDARIPDPTPEPSSAVLDQELSPLTEKYAQGNFPLEMTAESFNLMDDDKLFESLDSFYQASGPLALEEDDAFGE